MLNFASKLIALMQFFEIYSKIKQINAENLPGFEAQAKLSPPYRQKLSLEELKIYKPKMSAVMLLVYNKNNIPHIVLTQRQEYKGVHSRQISFPGGQTEKQDKNLLQTALRETYEEIGVSIAEDKVLKEITWLYVPPSNFLIYPYVALVDKTLNFNKDDVEVKSILEIPLTDFMNKNNLTNFDYYIKSQDISINCPCFNINGHIIWGATAMILNEFLTILEQ
ncbi:MAG: CoA pyrophosphatase [Bacteroidetes bacterium]|nr:CoA pyrophosphatase [Bacteroidota bacterium]MCB9227711.1 CoA pyrophosphatase [Chitinophagales bacterium]